MKRRGFFATCGAAVAALVTAPLAGKPKGPTCYMSKVGAENDWDVSTETLSKRDADMIVAEIEKRRRETLEAIARYEEAKLWG